MAKTVAERLNDIILQQLGIDPEELKPTSSFVDDLGADSLDTIELVMACEEEFNISIEDEDAENLKTVQDAIDYLEKRIEEKEAAKTGV